MNEIVFLENPDLYNHEPAPEDIPGHQDASEIMYSEDTGDLKSFMEKYEEMSIKDVKEDLSDGIDEMQSDFDKHHELVQKNFDDVQDELNKEFDDIIDRVGEKAKLKDIVPGTDIRLDSKEDEKDDSKKTYEEDRFLPDFQRYVSSLYPSEIPKHDGKSMLGCEKAISWLQRLSNEISTNVRNDPDGILDVPSLSKVQDSILADIFVLKEHMKTLKKSLPENMSKMASDNVINKVASVPNNMVICISPFMRAITGIIINSTVSAGKPFDEVYDYLVEKYEITEREQLEILQILMDMGQPIFKDRGEMPGSKENKKTKDAEESLRGIDFIDNYFV